MNRFIGVAPWCAVAALCAIGAGWMYFDSRQSPPQPPRTTEVESEPVQERTRQLDRQLNACRSRLRARLRILQDVASGRRSLLDAAEHYRDLCETNPQFDREGFREYYPGDTDDERYCWSIIMGIGNELENSPGKARTVTQRLESEIQKFREKAALILRP